MISKNAVSLTLVALGSLTACASTPTGQTIDPPANGGGDSALAIEHVDENLARLTALNVFQVGELIVHMPEGSMNCYGPCPGYEKAIEQAKGDAAVRLSKLADAAEEAAALSPASDACEKTTIDANIAALTALDVVGVVGLIQEQPKNNPQCYNLPCAEDTKAAEAITCARAGKLANIVKTAGEALK